MGKRFFILFSAFAITVLINSCELVQEIGTKNISVITIPASSVSSISALSGGVVRTGDGFPVTTRGICWSTETDPTVNLSSKTTDSTSALSFSCILNNLVPNTVYYVKAFAESRDGVFYGNELSFKTTQPTIPLVATTKPSGITGSSAISGGLILNDGGSAIKSRGVCWSTSENPQADKYQMTVDSAGTGSFISRISGLLANKRYYVRAYAVNNVGTVYGEQVSFVTSPSTLALLNTGTPSDITQNTATVTGNITNDNGSPVTSRGICWSERVNPEADKDNKTVNGSGMGTFSGVITGLIAGRSYYARAYAINSPGISYGNTVSFTTGMPLLPSVTTLIPGTVTYNSALGGGIVTNDGGAQLTARGICWSINENPSVSNSAKTVDGSGKGQFVSQLTGLSANTNYYVRAYATGVAGTAYGNQFVFKTNMKVPPVVNTGSITNITFTGAKAEGYVLSDGGAEVFERGICLSTVKEVSVENGIKIVCGSGTGAFTGTVQRLQPGTKYYLRSYAISGEGTSYGSEVTFLTIEGELKQLVGMSYLGTGEVIPELQSNDSGWHYFAFTKGANGDGKIYIDGVLASEGSFDNERYFYSSLFLGAGYSSEWSGFYKGWLDELRVSNIVRSPESIREHYYSNRAFSCDANTFGLFHFNEGEGSVIKPVVGNAGRLYNGVEFTRGKFSYALYFDGLDDKGDCNMNIPENNITIEFWAKPDGIQDATIIQPFGFYNSNIFLKAVVGN